MVNSQSKASHNTFYCKPQPEQGQGLVLADTHQQTKLHPCHPLPADGGKVQNVLVPCLLNGNHSRSQLSHQEPGVFLLVLLFPVTPYELSPCLSPHLARGRCMEPVSP